MSCSDKNSLSLQLNNSNVSLSRFPSIENIEYIDVLKFNKNKQCKSDNKKGQETSFGNFIFPPNMKIYKERSIPVEEKNSVQVINEEKKKNSLLESFKRKKNNRIIKEKNLNLIKKKEEEKKEFSNNSKTLISNKIKQLENEINEMSSQDQTICSNCPYCKEEEAMKTKKIYKYIKILNDNN
uniref:BZIP domain-containing protein n=1 Tax=Strongyloides stercoralis TaxID=6248 RepID=A0A0K0EMT9_STRER